MSKPNLDMLRLALRKFRPGSGSDSAEKTQKDIAIERALQEFEEAEGAEAKAAAFKTAIRAANLPE